MSHGHAGCSPTLAGSISRWLSDSLTKRLGVPTAAATHSGNVPVGGYSLVNVHERDFLYQKFVLSPTWTETPIFLESKIVNIL